MEFDNKEYHFKYYPLLVALATTCMISSLILIYRLVQIGTFTEPGGVFLFPLSFLIGDVIAEVYGYNHARRQVWYITFCLIVFTTIITIVINLPTPESKLDLAKAFNTAMGNDWRVCIGFISGMFVSDWLNVYLISRWRILLKGKHFWMRIIGANAISKIIFSIVCGAISFYNVVNLEMYIKLVVDVWLFKMLYVTVMGYLMLYVSKILKQLEKTNHKAYSYNPFIQTEKRLSQ